jgi:hypothetical protein|tara:strand:+ start:43 stop:1050 length:1008 start_codon:yes stop_codon:yes gene_type:complete
MAETNFQAQSNISLLFAKDDSTTALGTAHDAGDNWLALPVISFSMPHDSAALDVGPQRSGTHVQLENQMRHRRDLNTWTFDVSFKGTPTAILAVCQWAFGDGATSADFAATVGIGNGTSNSTIMKHGTAYANHTTVVFSNAGSDATANDIVVKGCIVQSFTIKEAVGSDAGQLICDATFWTAYAPSEAANAITADSTDTAAPKSIFSKNTTTFNSEALVLDSWDMTCSRSLERISSQDYSSYLPFGYTQTSPWEVTGTLSAKRDDSVYDALSVLQGASAGVNISIDESSGFTLDIPDAMVDASSINDGGSHLFQTIPYRASAATPTANVWTLAIS